MRNLSQYYTTQSQAKPSHLHGFQMSTRWHPANEVHVVTMDSPAINIKEDHQKNH